MMPPPDDRRRRRVPKMAPEQRRAALISATVPLLHRHGCDVSTRQIAAAAGVAEGTIFGVYPDKNSLVVAALTHALDPRPTLDALATIDAALGLRERLGRAAALVHDRFTSNARLMHEARRLLSGADPESARRMTAAHENLLAALTAVVAPDAARLRRSPATTARMLLLFCGADAYGPFGDPARFDGDELASLLLDGLLDRHTDIDEPGVR